MTIKELEVRSGIPRATIRYYEQVGLLKPLREPNGYRDYSEADLAALEKILLLRELQLPLEEIRALQAGEKSLDESLSAQLQILEQQSAGLQRAQLLCRTLLEEKVSFQALDAAACLRRLKESAPENRPSPVLAADTAPASPPHPWRRYFARAIDLLLYGSRTLNLPELIVPHPRMHERAFVLAPLADIAPDLVLAQGRIGELLDRLRQPIERLP